ncbi:predicted protein [Naegleria gruberi]|uniref:Predicted protein n=1 Tax=Naegleria gruberi TaxID=5762 RepID=D2VUZ4_NAEGR|nr:uncharacterized protein NAEGRDRAFT_72836 [Naegleria gruberi]EFC39404.1 predicted protein [Naegleria gruberi]|eukprot:XP_002672148.1 predicted protein [Naegleria gruberi strain NEG-M]
MQSLFRILSAKAIINKKKLLLTTAAATITTSAYFLLNNNNNQVKFAPNEDNHDVDQHHRSVLANNLIIQAEEKSSPTNNSPYQPKKKLVILGSGWASVGLIQSIDLDLYDVYVVSPRNYFLFTPMLPAALAGTVSMQSITEPIRSVINRVRKDKSLIEYYEAECYDVDYERGVIKCKDISNYVIHHQNGSDIANDFELKYDKLVIAVGSQPNSFGVKGVDQYSVPMKQPEHAVKIREKLLDVLESACMPNLTDEERQKALSVVVVGGGHAGIETLGYLVDFVKEDISKLFPKDIVEKLKITVIHSSDHILNTYDCKISEMCEKEFIFNNVDLKTNARVVEVRENDLVVVFKDQQKKSEPVSLPFGVCIWTTGVAQVPLVKKLAENIYKQKNEKSLVVDAHLQVVGLNNVYAIGDCSKIDQPKLVQKYESFFEQADINKDGVISFTEMESLIKAKEKEYPNFATINQKLKKLFTQADVNGDNVLSKDEFKSLIQRIDNEYYAPLPQTAQVASKQGSYLGNCLNDIEKGITYVPPFTYKNLGSFAYIGNNHAVADLSGTTVTSWQAFYLYRAAYLSKQVSWKNRFSLASDWVKTAIFGRDVSRF